MSSTTQVTKHAESRAKQKTMQTARDKTAEEGGRGRRQPREGGERRDSSTRRQKRRIVREALAPGVSAAPTTSGAAAPKLSVNSSAGLDIGPIRQ